jgi:hypothetical protein
MMFRVYSLLTLFSRYASNRTKYGVIYCQSVARIRIKLAAYFVWNVQRNGTVSVLTFVSEIIGSYCVRTENLRRKPSQLYSTIPLCIYFPPFLHLSYGHSPTESWRPITRLLSNLHSVCGPKQQTSSWALLFYVSMT